jgi:23S rRNA-intervening sequence protein
MSGWGSTFFSRIRGGIQRAPSLAQWVQKRFQDLIAWQLARELRKFVNEAAFESSISRDSGLCDQLRRPARSVTSNIAEGFPCPSHIEFARFLDIAGQFLTDAQAARGFNLAKRTSVAIARLSKYLRDNP